MTISLRRTVALGAAGVFALAGTAITATQAQAAPAAPRTCQVSDLYVSAGTASPGAGQLYVTVVFTNTSTTACALRGYPGASLVGVDHAEVAPPATRTGEPVSTVTINPGSSASALLHTTNGPIGGPCSAASTYLRIYPPASYQAVLIPYTLEACSNVFTVSPVHAGTQG
ncbi:DUF4232 domain-containing protein [Kitasatospora sp. NPDC052896]|uniref:DUF4232 domain-containing protein n=1 Tax=Kitasatospora sp. NPDC052896 TaxID=3364061 RepID=UPI0037CAF0E8